MIGKEFFERLKVEKGNIFGNLFRYSVELGYDSLFFVREVMLNPAVEDLIFLDERAEWCDDHFLMSKLDNVLHFKTGKTYDDYFMWFLGYLYKYWMRDKNLKPAEVYKILPFERFEVMYCFYHTQGWDYIIKDATRVYNSGDFVV